MVDSPLSANGSLVKCNARVSGEKDDETIMTQDDEAEKTEALLLGARGALLGTSVVMDVRLARAKKERAAAAGRAVLEKD